MSGAGLAGNPATAEEWRQYICRACGLVYDEADGDPDSFLPPGTRFEDIPDDWECPLCGVRKTDFELLVAHAPVTAVAPASRAPRGLGVVIVGAGLAGRATAEALRVLDPALPITLVTACSGDVYNKPELSVAFARGLTPRTLCRESGAAMARRLNLRLLDGAFAIGVSPATSTLRTTRGTLRYAHLVLAQGARPALPAALSAGVAWRVNDLQGWSGLHQRLQGGPKRIAIVGGGMVGCELAEDFAQAGHAVILLDRNAGPLAGLLPTEASQRLRRRQEAAGIRLIAPVIVREARRIAEGVLVTTECGQSIEVDELVAATGLATDTRLARSAGLVFNRGIVVDATTLETSAKNIYALGDCISIDGAPCRFIEPIARQAAAIASHILGVPTAGYTHKAPVVRLKTRSMPLALHGVPHPDGEWRTVRNDADRLDMEQWFAGELRCRLAA